MIEPLYFHLGAEAEQAMCDWETYEQLCFEVGLPVIEEDQDFE